MNTFLKSLKISERSKEQRTREECKGTAEATWPRPALLIPVISLPRWGLSLLICELSGGHWNLSSPPALTFQEH